MIAIDGRALLESTPGGIQIVTRSLVNAFVSKTPETSVVFVTRRKHVPKLSNSLVIRRSNRLWLLRHALGIGEPMDVLVQSKTGVWPAVVFAPTLQPIATAKSPLVLMIHDCSFFRFPSWMQHKDRWWHQLIAPGHIIERAAAIICPSHATRAELEHFVPSVRSRITVIPWGPPSPLKIDELRMKNNKLPYVLAIGTRQRRKNPELLARLKTFLQRMNRPHELVTIDPSHAVEEEEKWQLLFDARALLYPSFYEGFGLPVLEAMAAGVPVIASLSSSMVEITGSAGVLLTPYSPEQWQESLKAVLMDEALRRSLITRGRERVSQFSWDRCRDAVLAVLRSTT